MKCLIVLSLIKLALVYSSSLPATKSPTPLVLWHGMGDTCCASYSLGPFIKVIQNAVKDIYIVSLKIGNSAIEELENGYFLNPNKQVDYVCKILAKDKKLKNGFNVVGFSQGAQFLRAVVQRCGHRLPPIKNLISLGGQHQGVYGLPNCGTLQHKTCDYLRKLLNHAAYYDWVQDSLVQATYWHDPLDETSYKEKSKFLSDINNELAINKTYVSNLRRLEHLVLVLFETDSVVQPRETEWFGYYAPGQDRTMLTLREMPLYTEDRLGLKKMDEAGQLVFLSLPGNHLQFSVEWFMEKIFQPYLV